MGKVYRERYGGVSPVTRYRGAELGGSPPARVRTKHLGVLFVCRLQRVYRVRVDLSSIVAQVRKACYLGMAEAFFGYF